MKFKKKEVIGILIIIIGFIVGLFVGIWWGFIGGIVDVIQSCQGESVNAFGVAWGIFKYCISGGLGILVGCGICFVGFSIAE